VTVVSVLLSGPVEKLWQTLPEQSVIRRILHEDGLNGMNVPNCHVFFATAASRFGFPGLAVSGEVLGQQQAETPTASAE
jgi:hypothetical protein